MTAVIVLLHGSDRLTDAIERHLVAAGASVSRLRLDEATDAGLTAADLQHASALVLTSSDDAMNVDLALTARRLRTDLPLVVRIFEESLAEYLKRTLPGVTTLSMSGLAAPAFAKATSDAIASQAAGGRVADAAAVARARPSYRRPNADRLAPAVEIGRAHV